MKIYLIDAATDNLAKLSALIDKIELCQRGLNGLFDQDIDDEELINVLEKYQFELNEKRTQLEFSRHMIRGSIKAYKDNDTNENEEALNDNLKKILNQLSNPSTERLISKTLKHVPTSISDEDLIKIGDPVDTDLVKHSFNLTKKFLDFITKDGKSSEIISRWLNSNQ